MIKTVMKLTQRPRPSRSPSSTTWRTTFGIDPSAGTGAGADKNRAKVFSNSDSVGEWVKIREVVSEGSTDAHPLSNIYLGSIKLSDDSSATEADDGKLWVRDGDTMTVEIYDDDNTTVIAKDTAEIDGENPAISGLTPSGGVIKNTSPVITFTVIDNGAGFDTNNPRDHITLTVTDRMRDCQVPERNVTATRLSRTEIEMLVRNRAGSWVDGLSCVQVDENDKVVLHPTTGQEVAASPQQIDTTSGPRDNNHGTEFTIKVVATDVAGNKDEATAEVTIDTKSPTMEDEQLKTGLTWDGKATQPDRASIMVVFDESVDPDTVDASDFSVENPDASVEDVIVGGVNKKDGPQQKNELVFLVLSAELPSDAQPRVELDGSVTDVAGNELKSDAVSRIQDGIEPGVTVDGFPAQLLAEDGESAISLSADENLSGNVGDLDADCTCLGITGGEHQGVTKGDVALPTPKAGTYTFEQSEFSDTGIYGILVQASDSSGNRTTVGVTEVTDEKVTASKDADGEPKVSGGEVTLDPDLNTVAEMEGLTATTTFARWTVTVPLANWPLADAEFTGSLEGAVTIKGTDAVKDKDDAGDIPGTKVMNVKWDSGEVTLQLNYKDKATAISGDTELLATYSYVNAEQTIEVDTTAPMVDFEPKGNSESATPFIRIHFDDDEYAGDTHTTVTVMSATLSDADGNEWVLADEDVNHLSSSDWMSYSYLPDSPLALGEYTIEVTGEDEAGNSVTDDGTFKIVARPPVSIPLNLGWNLMSLPAEPADSAIDVVINVAEVSQVLTYDPTVEGGWLAAVRVNGAFEGGLTSIDATRSYLVYTTSVDPLKVEIPGLAQGSQEFPPAIQLHKGWNMVPASSLNPDFPARDVDSYLTGVKWSRGYYYDSNGRLTGFISTGEVEDDELVVKGRGFIIYVTETSTLVP